MEEKEEQTCVLVLPSLRSIAGTFTKQQLEDSADLELRVPGFDTPMKLNKVFLVTASQLFANALKNADCAWLRMEDANARLVKMEWVAQSTDPATEGAAVQNVLKLCYGQEASVDTHTAAATIAIMNAMQFRDAQATDQLVEWMKEQANQDVAMGIRMVCECGMFERLYNNIGGKEVAVELAGHVMTRVDLKKHWDEALVDELMELPPIFVVAVEYGSAHDKFMAMRRYIKYNEQVMSIEDKEELLRQCGLSELDSKDADRLCMLGVFSEKELNTVLCAVLRRTESKLGATEKELQASEMERVEQGKRLATIAKQLDQKEKELQEWYNFTNQLPLGALSDLLKCQAPAKALDLKGERLNSLKHTLLNGRVNHAELDRQNN